MLDGVHAQLAAEAREALVKGDHERLAKLMDENFNTRRSIYNLPPGQVEMVELARSCGASAKFAGSGGAIIGTYHEEKMFEQLQRKLAAIGCHTIKPQVAVG